MRLVLRGWTTQQAQDFLMHIDDYDLECETLTQDRDSKYTDAFHTEFKSSNCKIKLTSIRSPNLQAHVERVIQTIKHEVLNAFCIVSNQHLDKILKTTQAWYNHRRCHSSREHLRPVRDEIPTVFEKFSKSKVVCKSEFGGHLISYRRAA